MNCRKLCVLTLTFILLLGSYGCNSKNTDNKPPENNETSSNQANQAAGRSISNFYNSKDEDIIHEKNLTEQDGWVYYHNPDDKSRLYKRSMDGSRNIKISDNIAGTFCLDGEWLYYSDYTGNQSLYRIKTDGSAREKLNSDECCSINVSKEWVYYRNISDNDKLYKVKKDGTGRAKIADDSVNSIYVGGGDWIYYINSLDNNCIYTVGMDGLEGNRISDKSSYWLCASEEWVYFEPTEKGTDYLNIFKVKRDGTEETSILNGNPYEVITQLEVFGDYLYYHTYNADNALYRIRKDGTDLTKLSAEGEHVGIFDISKEGLLFYSTFFKDSINKMDLKSKKETVINKPSALDSKHLAEWILYNDWSNTLGINFIKDDKEEYESLLNRTTSNIRFIGNTAYFLVKSGENSNLCKLDANDSKPQVISEGNITTFDTADELIYYYDSKEHALNCIKTNGTGRKHISNIRVENIQVDGEWIYYTLLNNAIYRMKIDGTENRQLASNSSSIGSFRVSGDWIYFSEDMGLSKIKTDGTEKTRICDVPTGVGPIYMIKDSRLYYDIIFAEGGGYYEWYNGLYSIKLDGTDKEVLLEATFKTWAVDENYAYYGKIIRDINIIKSKSDGTDRKAAVSDLGWY